MMTSKRQMQSEHFSYWDDSRSQREIQLANKYVQFLSQQNLKDLSKPQKSNITPFKISKKDFLYVCLHGSPPFQNQFSHLQLPGQSLTFRFPFYDNNLRDAQLKQMHLTWRKVSSNLHSKISLYPNKPIVFVYHSFGGFIFTKYLFYYPQTIAKIVGLVELGAPPIRFYQSRKQFITKFMNINIEQFEKNLDHYYQQQIVRRKNQNVILFKNKYQYLAYFKLLSDFQAFKDMFQLRRNAPKILRCIIYGRKDSIFFEKLLNQKAIHFIQQIDRDQLEKWNLAYFQIFGLKCTNSQQKFIFNLKQGYHSFHMQTRYRTVINKIVTNYINLIEKSLNPMPSL